MNSALVWTAFRPTRLQAVKDQRRRRPQLREAARLAPTGSALQQETREGITFPTSLRGAEVCDLTRIPSPLRELLNFLEKLLIRLVMGRASISLALTAPIRNYGNHAVRTTSSCVARRDHCGFSLQLLCLRDQQLGGWKQFNDELRTRRGKSSAACCIVDSAETNTKHWYANCIRSPSLVQ